MQPKTKVQKEVVELSEQLPPLTLAQTIRLRQHFYEMDFPGYLNKKTHIATCTLCGHQWHAPINTISNEMVCPCCGKKLKMEVRRKTTPEHMAEAYYGSISQTFRDWQIVRTFCVRRDLDKWSKKVGLIFGVFEVQQVWANGETSVTLQCQKSMYGYYCREGLQFSLGKPLTVRTSNEYIRTQIDITDDIHPILVKHGFDGNCRDYYPAYLFKTLMNDNVFESYWKRGLFDLCEQYCNKPWNKQVEKPLKDFLRIRKGWKDKHEMTEWFDMIGMMIELGKDINKTSLTCPDDIHKRHDKYMDLLRRKHAAEREERRRLENLAKIERDKSINETYVAEHKKFLDMKLENYGLVATVLPDVKAFEEEGTAMKHCVFTMGYYDKKRHPNSLILSIRDAKTNERVETCEVLLNTMKIAQCYGIHDSITDLHTYCCELINENMKIIKQFNARKEA